MGFGEILLQQGQLGIEDGAQGQDLEQRQSFHERLSTEQSSPQDDSNEDQSLEQGRLQGRRRVHIVRDAEGMPFLNVE